jgi:copper(I)-binding protein
MNKPIEVTDVSEQENIPVRRRFAQGRQTTAVSITLPNDLNQTINGIVVKTSQTRSQVITTLIEKGLQNHE